MKLKELFQNLALGDLSSSPLVGIGAFELDPTHLPKVIHSINQALEYFYTNFPLKTNTVIIHLRPDTSLYCLDSDYAYSVPNDLPKFILDTPEKPFINDVLHILEVSNTEGRIYPLNDDLAMASVSTPEYNCIRTQNIQDKYLVIKYLASHPIISLHEPLDSNVRIQIPSSYRSALQTYVACIVLHNMGGVHLQESNALFAKFKTLTDELKLQGIGTITQTGSNIKPILRGWL